MQDPNYGGPNAGAVTIVLPKQVSANVGRFGHRNVVNWRFTFGAGGRVHEVRILAQSRLPITTLFLLPRATAPIAARDTVAEEGNLLQSAADPRGFQQPPHVAMELLADPRSCDDRGG